MSLQGRTALVNGAARGIGLATSERLLRDGARVALVDRDVEVGRRRRPGWAPGRRRSWPT